MAGGWREINVAPGGRSQEGQLQGLLGHRAWKNASRIGRVTSSHRRLCAGSNLLPVPALMIVVNAALSGRSGANECRAATIRAVVSCGA